MLLHGVLIYLSLLVMANFKKIKEQIQVIDIFQNYPSYPEIEKFLLLINRTEENVFVEAIGNTTKGHPIYLVKIDRNIPDNSIVYMQAGIIANESMSVMVALYTIQMLAVSSAKSNLTRINWMIVPVVNPDGYMFSLSSEENRYWIKNKGGSYCKNCKQSCGTNLNHNFPIFYGIIGALVGPCEQGFQGAKPISEKETEALVNLFDEWRYSIKLFLDIHNYGGTITYPSAFMESNETIDARNDDSHSAQQRELAEEACKVINRRIPNESDHYKFGQHLKIEHPESGTPMDYVSQAYKIPFVFNINVRDIKDDGSTPEEEKIMQLSAECFEAIKFIVEQVQIVYPPPKWYLRQEQGYKRRQGGGCAIAGGALLVIVTGSLMLAL